MTQDILSAVTELNKILKAQRPEFSVQYSNAESARDVADILRDSVVGYGEGEVQDNGDGTFTLTATGIDMETMDAAFKYLWWKPVAGDPSTYAMSGIPYRITAVKSGEGVEFTVSEE